MAKINASDWRVVYTKARCELRAEENLRAQGFEVYLPMIDVEKVRRGKFVIASEPLFARYLFVRASSEICNWSAIRSTKGVSYLLRFGSEVGHSICVPDQLIESIKQGLQAYLSMGDGAVNSGDVSLFRRKLFFTGQAVDINRGIFQGSLGIFHKIAASESGEARALVLLEFLGKPQLLTLPFSHISASTI